MRRLAGGLAAAILVIAGLRAQAQQPSPEALEAMRADQNAYHMAADTPGEGPFPAIKSADPAFPGHVVYRPANLAALGDHKLPVVIWGNGGCTDDGASERLFLEEIASHGFLVVAPGAILSGPGVPPQPEPPPGPRKLAARTTADQVLKGLDEAGAANAPPGPWRDRIDLTKVAVAGYSCGGLQALQIASDPRIKAVVIMHSGIFVSGRDEIEGIHVEKSQLARLHTPILYVLGGPRDIAFENGSDDVAKISATPVFLASHDVGHGGTYHKPNGGDEAPVVLHWLDWQLGGDTQSAKAFLGADCGLCRDPEWTVTRKGF